MRKVSISTIPLYFFLVVLLSSCASYRQNIMFKTDKGSAIEDKILSAEKNYIIQNNDFLTLDVFTNEGERIIDPDFKLAEGMVNPNLTTRRELKYLVNEDGNVKFPMVGLIPLRGLTIREAEEILQKEYTKFYRKPFVSLRYENKRVIILGAPGGQVIPLMNENVRLVEVLALATGLPNDSKAHNIRVLRGDQVFLADLSTFEGYTKHNIIMEPGDVVYVEPIRRPFVEGVRDYGPALSILTSISTLLIVLIGL